MKDKIEHKFKELLENQELPYNSAAWDSMSKALDKKMPVNKPTNWYKWFLGGAAITVIAVSSYFISSNQKSTQNNKSEISDNQPVNSKKENKHKENKLNKSEIIYSNLPSNSNEQDKDQKSTVSDEILNVDEQKMTGLESNNISNPIVNPTNLNSTNKIGIVEGIQDDIKLPDPPSLSKTVNVKNVCVGESQIIENKNSFPVELINQSGNEVFATIKANGSINFEATTPGMYIVKAKNTENQFLSNSFEVKSVSRPSLEVENEVHYVKAIPTIKAKSNSESNLTWSVNGKVVQSLNGEIEINPYKSGTYSVTVSSNLNGCKTENLQVINVEEDYNLLAVNAFNPTSFELKNQTFIPYAITQREVKFTMIIIDPRDGGIVYKTSDSSQPWDGTDIRKGQQVPSNQSFIWKVQLMNPLPGEPTEYKGTITKL